MTRIKKCREVSEGMSGRISEIISKGIFKKLMDRVLKQCMQGFQEEYFLKIQKEYMSGEMSQDHVEISKAIH